VKKAIFSLIPLVLLYLIAETSLSALNMSPFAPLPAVTPAVEKSRVTPWGDTRMVKERIYLGAPTAYEAPFFRAFLPPLSKNRAVKRVVFIGDSFVFGVGVAEYETLPFYLSAYMRYYRPEIAVEMVNLGRPAADTNAYVNMAELGATYQPDLVVLGFTVANDAEIEVGKDSPAGPEPNERSTNQKSVWGALQNLRGIRDSILPYSRTLSAIYRPIRRYEARARMDLHLKNTFDDANKWRVVRQNLVTFARYFEQRNVATIFTIYPCAFTTTHVGLNEIEEYPYARYHERLVGAARAARFTVVIDYLDYFRKAEVRSFDDYIVSGDGHPNGAFNALVAKHFASDLLQRSLP
jgi:hypothetical protein